MENNSSWQRVLYELLFYFTLEDIRRVLLIGVWNLSPKVFRVFVWTKDFISTSMKFMKGCCFLHHSRCFLYLFHYLFYSKSILELPYLATTFLPPTLQILIGSWPLGLASRLQYPSWEMLSRPNHHWQKQTFRVSFTNSVNA